MTIFWFAPRRFWDIIRAKIALKLEDGEEGPEDPGRFDYIKSIPTLKIPTPTIELTEKGKKIGILLLIGLVLLAGSSD